MKKTLLSRFLPVLLIVLLSLGGCVRYDVGVNFAEQHRGAIVQNIRLGQQLTSLSGLEAKKWLSSLEDRTKYLQGSVKHLSDSEIQITLPFSNGQELVEKFNQFFNPTADSQRKSGSNKVDLLPLKSEMALNQSNWLFADRNKLHLTVDLQALGILSQQGNVIISPGDLIDLQFVLTTPWGAKYLLDNSLNTANFTQNGQQLRWKLQPGQVNQLDAVFWTPSYLAWGTVAIIVFSILGFVLKYRHFPGINGS